MDVPCVTGAGQRRTQRDSLVVATRAGQHRRSLVSDSHQFGAGPPEKHKNLFWEVTSGAVSAFVVRQWTHALRRLSTDLGRIARFLRAGGPRTPRSTLFYAQCLARQWYMLCVSLGAFGRLSRTFYANEETRILKSFCPALLLGGERSAQ